MARIHYGLAGEGRGHAVRARTLIEALRGQHTLVVHAPGDAYELLEPLHRGDPAVEVRRLPGLRWAYGPSGRVDLVRSSRASAAYLRGMPALVSTLARTLREERAELVLTDFEPALSRAAARVNVPLVSVDHQAFLTTSDFSALPLRLRAHAAFLGAFVRRWTPPARMQVVSSFYRPALRRGLAGDVRQVGVLLRRAVREAVPSRGGFLLAYLRPGVPERVLDVLRRAPVEVRLYGRGAGEPDGALVPRPIDEAGFLRDLAACEGLVSTAGNQLIGEALALGKPVLAAPELGNAEQEMNAWYLARTPGARATTFARFDSAELSAFLSARDTLAAQACEADTDGTRATFAALAEAVTRYTPRALRPLRRDRARAVPATPSAGTRGAIPA